VRTRVRTAYLFFYVGPLSRSLREAHTGAMGSVSARVVAGVTLAAYIVLVLPFLTGLISPAVTAVLAVVIGVAGWIASRFTRSTDGTEPLPTWEHSRSWERLDGDLVYGNMRSHASSCGGSAPVRKRR